MRARPSASVAPSDGGDSAASPDSARAAWVADAKAHQWYRFQSGFTICTQPAGWVTDYAFTALCLWCGTDLWAAHATASDAAAARVQCIAKFLWSFAALGALGAGVHHYCHVLVQRVERGALAVGAMDGALSVLWSGTLSVCGLHNYYMFAAASRLWYGGDAGAADRLTTIAIPVYLSLSCAVAYYQKIVIHIASSLPTIFFFVAASVAAYGAPARALPPPAACVWNLVASAVLLAGGAVTKQKIAPSAQYFNHNALMHCLAMVASVCLYFGALADAAGSA